MNSAETNPGQLQNESPPQALDLAKQLAQSRDDLEIMSTSRAIAALGPAAIHAAPVLERILQEAEPAIAAAAAFLLAEIGPPLLDDSPGVVQLLIDRMSHRDGEVRHWVAVALGRMGPRAVEAVPVLIRALSDQDDGVRLTAMHALNEMGHVAREAAPHLSGLLADPIPIMRQAAVKALLRVDPKAERIGPRLAHMLDHAPASPRIAAAHTLALMQDAPRVYRDAAIHVLLDSLLSSNPEVRREAVETLGRISNPSEEIIVALANRLADSHEYVRYEAAQSLLAHDTAASAAAPILLAALQDPEETVRAYALSIIERVPIPDADLRPAVTLAILNAMNDPCDTVRSRAVAAFAQTCDPAYHVDRALLEYMNNAEPETRRIAANALGRVGRSNIVRDTLHAHLTEENPHVCVATAHALWRLDHDASVVLDILISMLDTDAVRLCIDSLCVLKEMGNCAADAAPHIEKLLTHSDEMLARLARETLETVSQVGVR